MSEFVGLLLGGDTTLRIFHQCGTARFQKLPQDKNDSGGDLTVARAIDPPLRQGGRGIEAPVLRLAHTTGSGQRL